ncbi:hypothetical protein [Glycomyces tarimensis]
MRSHGSKSAGRGRSGARAAQTLIDQFEKDSALRRAKIVAVLAAVVTGVMALMVTIAFLPAGEALVASLIVAAVAGVVAAGVSLVWPVLRVAWHWAGELVLASVIVGVYAALAVWLAPIWGLVAVGVLVGLPWVFGPVRRFLIRWGWCMVTRHRLRVACDAFMEGKGVRGAVMPLILIARPTESGERVWLWLRGDLTLKDIEDRLPELASVCWANAADARKAGQKASFVVIDLHRRDILAEDVPMPVKAMLDGVDPDSYKGIDAQDIDAEGEDVTADPELVAKVEAMLNPRRSGERKPRQSKADKAGKSDTTAAVRRDNEGPDEGDGDYIPEFV